MYCVKCGKYNDDNAFKCVNCGLIIQQIPTPHTPQKLEDDPTTSMLIPVGRTPLSIIAGYAGLFSVLILPAPIALLLSILAIYDLKKQPGKLGMGRAVFGLIAGIIGTVVLAFLLIL